MSKLKNDIDKELKFIDILIGMSFVVFCIFVVCMLISLLGCVNKESTNPRSNFPPFKVLQEYDTPSEFWNTSGTRLVEIEIDGKLHKFLIIKHHHSIGITEVRQ